MNEKNIPSSLSSQIENLIEHLLNSELFKKTDYKNNLRELFDQDSYVKVESDSNLNPYLFRVALSKWDKDLAVNEVQQILKDSLTKFFEVQFGCNLTDQSSTNNKTLLYKNSDDEKIIFLVKIIHQISFTIISGPDV